MRTPRRPSPGGFTLIEVVITLCVFVLLAAAVFGIFTATLESASGLQDNQTRNDQAESLNAWLKHSLLDMPANGTVSTYHRDDIPFHTAGLAWGAGNDLQALDLHLQDNGEYTLRITVYQGSSSLFSGQEGGLTGTLPPIQQFVSEIERNDSSLVWRTLMRDLKSADWRFLSFNNTQWQDVVLGKKPAVVELTFQQAGTATSVTEDFWVPPTQAPDSLAVPPAPAVSSNP